MKIYPAYTDKAVSKTSFFDGKTSFAEMKSKALAAMKKFKPGDICFVGNNRNIDYPLFKTKIYKGATYDCLMRSDSWFFLVSSDLYLVEHSKSYVDVYIEMLIIYEDKMRYVYIPWEIVDDIGLLFR